jgi:hypothetical protein
MATLPGIYNDAARPIAKRTAADALLNCGVSEEGGNNRGQYIGIYQASTGNSPGDPWCASFVYYRLFAAAKALGKTLPPIVKSGYTPDWKNWAIKNNNWVSASRARTSPFALLRVGDLVCFYSPTKERIYHIGIVVSVHSWGVMTVEGNTGPEGNDPLAVNADGDGVYKKRREWSELGSYGGFIRINW